MYPNVLLNIINQYLKFIDGELLYTFKVNIEFNLEGGILVYQDKIYISDSYGNCVHILDKHGNFIKKFGHHGSNNGEFKFPYSLTLLNNQIYVIDCVNERVQVFDLDGNYIKMFRYGNNDLNTIGSFTNISSSQDKIYVTDWNYNRIQVFSSDNIFLKYILIKIDLFICNGPHSMIIFNNHIYIIRYHSKFVKIYNMDGILNNEILLYTYPTGIAGYGNLIYVSCDKHIEVYHKNGQFVKTWKFRHGSGIYIQDDLCYLVYNNIISVYR